MRRVVFDTNIYIDWINVGAHEDLLFERDIVKHLSAIVVLELRAGAHSVRDRQWLERIERAFDQAGRVLVPSRAVYGAAGDVLRRLRAARGSSLEGRSGLVNDVLIALSARSIGATVVTQNERDFRAIQAVQPFQLAVVPAK